MGTLLRTDTLHEALLQLLRSRPLYAVRLLAQIGKGKAKFKQLVTQAAAIDVAILPLNKDVISYLKAQKSAGRELALYSAANMQLVQSVADYLKLFNYARGSDEVVNLSGTAKLAAIRERYGSNFCYAGNALVDLPIGKPPERPSWLPTTNISPLRCAILLHSRRDFCRILAAHELG